MRTSVAAIRAIQHYHQGAQGWADIGYHYLVDRAGRVWSGRAVRWQGAHASGDNNRQNIGVCLLGDYVPGSQGRPPRIQVRALARLLDDLCGVYSVDPKAILTHRELKSTTCPGPYLQAAVEQLREQLSAAAAPAGH